MTSGGRIAAVVVTFNRRAQLEVTLSRLLEESVDHIVVVDSGSTDGSREHVRGLDDPRIHPLFLDRNGGGAFGFEMGLREATGRFDPDWFVLMDDDARPEPQAIDVFRRRGFDCDVVAAAVRDMTGAICDMNRPWINPFWHLRTFISTSFGGGRDAFHMGPADYASDEGRRIDGASFVGLFLSREAVRRGGFPDGRMFIYGDDVHYTLGLTRLGLVSRFEPAVRFRHDISTVTAGGVFRPMWKAYYHHRNLWHVYRRAAGPILFWPLMMLVLPKWLLKGKDLPAEERSTFRRLMRRALGDAVRGDFSRTHDAVIKLAEERRGSSPHN